MARKGKKITFLNMLIISFLIVGCNDNYISSIPDFPVYMELNLTTTYPNFHSPNQSLTFIKPITVKDRIGYGGILVYIGFDNQYYAFDMSCPYEHQPTIRVYPNGLGQAVCEKCGSVFDIGYGIGNTSAGKAKEILKRYKVTLNGDWLYISR
jgi:nitrite reductase/ring-hydroxylating ferredoxin subunit